MFRKYADVLREHPEYVALVDGRRESNKFCVSNPGVHQLVLRYAREYFDANPGADCLSIEPSDGGGWCECEAWRRTGTPSDRALLLANLVSDYLQR